MVEPGKQEIWEYLLEDLPLERRAEFKQRCAANTLLRQELEDCRALLAESSGWLDEPAAGIERAAELAIPRLHIARGVARAPKRTVWRLYWQAAAALLIFVVGIYAGRSLDREPQQVVLERRKLNDQDQRAVEPDNTMEPRDGRAKLAQAQNTLSRTLISEENGLLRIEKESANTGGKIVWLVE